MIGASLLSVRAVNYPKLKHDEVISYLVATGHSRLYQTEKPSDRWVQASDWQAFWKLEKVGNFGTIVKDLNATDIHPPLYFWVLNLWSGVYGIHTSTGALLNIPFHILITLMIFFTCRLLKYPPLICAAAAVLWMVRSSIIEAGVITRQYSLLGLIVICFIYFTIRFKNKPTVINTIWMGLFSLFGLLTHYQFVLILGITFAWLVIFFYLRKNPAPILKVIAAIYCGSFYFFPDKSRIFPISDATAAATIDQPVSFWNALPFLQKFLRLFAAFPAGSDHRLEIFKDKYGDICYFPIVFSISIFIGSVPEDQLLKISSTKKILFL